MPKKPKPATAGEKIVMRWGYTLAWTREEAWLRESARRIDRIIARAVRKERERCVRIVTDYMQEGPGRMVIELHIRNGLSQ